MRHIIARCKATALRMTDLRRVLARDMAAARDHSDVRQMYARAVASGQTIEVIAPQIETLQKMSAERPGRWRIGLWPRLPGVALNKRLKT